MNVQIEDGHSSDESPAGYDELRREPTRPELVRMERRPMSNHRIEKPSIYIERRRSEEVKGHAGGVHLARRSRRRRSRMTPGHASVEKPRPASDCIDQDSDDVLDEYYSGMPMPTTQDLDHNAEAIHEAPLKHSGRLSGPPYGGALGAFPTYSPYLPRPYTTIPIDGRPPRPEQFELSDDVPPQPATIPHYTLDHSRFDSRPVRLKDNSMMTNAPPGVGGLWSRAAVASPKNPGRLTLHLKLVLSRQGERYKSSQFVYTTGTWDDVVFASQLKKEYRNLKTEKIGLMQKLTSYKTIEFVYFLQYHAFRNHMKRFKNGRWEITQRLPVTPQDDEKARSSFMYQLRKHARKQSAFIRDRQFAKPPSRDWVYRLDSLVEPGAVIELEVKETFDTKKIYYGLLLAVLLSLGAALAYGFSMSNDFSTGFSIASWILTAFGFFAAVVGIGEWLGLDSPRRTLSTADELHTGMRLPRQLLDGSDYMAHI